MNLEHELTKALRRQEPPDGFEQNVMARIASGERVRQPQTHAWRLRFVLPLAASVLVAVGAAYYVDHEQQRNTQAQRAQAERATRDVSRALQITSETLESMRTKLQGNNDHEKPTHP